MPAAPYKSCGNATDSAQDNKTVYLLYFFLYLLDSDSYRIIRDLLLWKGTERKYSQGLYKV